MIIKIMQIKLFPHYKNGMTKKQEDERFYSHSGIDFKATLRAIVFLGKRGGASTISQQLAMKTIGGLVEKGWKGWLEDMKDQS